jgi:hypothetical protein
LQRRVQELENTKDELQQHRDQIEVGVGLRFSDLFVISWVWERKSYFHLLFASRSYTVKMLLIIK